MSVWDRMNHTELLNLAQEHNANAHYGLSRDMLIKIIEGEGRTLPDRPVDKVRLKVMEFINDNWDQVRPFIRCPAQSRDPRSCFQCSDLQAASCAFTNHEIIFPPKDPA